MFDNLVQLLGCSVDGYENIIICMSCFLITMMFIFFVDILANGFFGLFRKERRK